MKANSKNCSFSDLSIVWPAEKRGILYKNHCNDRIKPLQNIPSSLQTKNAEIPQVKVTCLFAFVPLPFQFSVVIETSFISFLFLPFFLSTIDDDETRYNEIFLIKSTSNENKINSTRWRFGNARFCLTPSSYQR
jgi:hypothetical protein